MCLRQIAAIYVVKLGLAYNLLNNQDMTINHAN